MPHYTRLPPTEIAARRRHLTTQQRACHTAIMVPLPESRLFSQAQGSQMSMEPQHLAAAFFGPRHGPDRSLADLLQRAGATDCVPWTPAPGQEWLGCRWAGLSCHAYVVDRPAYQVLVIRFWQSDFLALLPAEDPLALAADPTLPLAEAFRAACVALVPVAAFLVTHLDQADPDWLMGREPAITAGDADDLLNEGLGLLYLSAALQRQLSNAPDPAKYDTLPVADGLLVFAGSGDAYSRWF